VHEQSAVRSAAPHGPQRHHFARLPLDLYWAAESTAFPNDVVEMALAHAVGTKVELAYKRSDMFEKRRRLMEAWAQFCGKETVSSAVVPMRAASPLPG
jgi:hypothetical protein